MEGLPPPNAHHEKLLAQVGTWKVKCTYYMDPSQPPMEAQATETIEAVGPYWTVSKFESDFAGMPFVGRATLGYDLNADEFVGTWIDCMSTALFVYRGQLDAASNVLDMRGEGFMPQMGAVCGFRCSTIWTDGDEHAFEMFVTPPGGDEFKMFHYDYTRA